MESVPDAVVTVDRNGLVTGWNREAVKLFGWSVEEALGKPLDDLVTTDTGRNEINSLSVIQGQVIRGMECTRRGRDSVEKKVFVSVAPIVTNGETRGQLVSIQTFPTGKPSSRSSGRTRSSSEA